MSGAWPRVPLGEVVEPADRWIAPEIGRAYRQLGVRLWGEGAYEREVIDGGGTKYAQLNRVEADDLVVNKIWARNGSVAVVQPSLAGCVVSGEFPTYTPRRNQIVPRWLHWMTKTAWFWHECDKRAQGTSGKNRIKPEQFLAVEIPLPPLAEQRRIVARLDALATKIEEAKGLQTALDAEREILRTSSRTPLLSPSALGEWPSMPLGDVSEIRSGVTLGRSLSGPTLELPYLRVANVQDGHLDLATIKTVSIRPEEADKWRLLPGDILLTEGGDWDKLGRGTVWHGEVDDCIHQNHIFRVRVNQSEFLPEYLSALLGSAYGKRYFQEASKQTTNLASINQRQLKAFVVFQPPLAEQQRIVDSIRAVGANLALAREEHVQTTARVNALLPSVLDRAFAGAL